MARKGPTISREGTEEYETMTKVDSQVKCKKVATIANYVPINDILVGGNDNVTEELLRLSSRVSINALRDLELYTDISTAEAKSASQAAKTIIDIHKTLLNIYNGIIKDEEIEYEE